MPGFVRAGNYLGSLKDLGNLSFLGIAARMFNDPIEQELLAVSGFG